jgi:hypothetical protein
MRFLKSSVLIAWACVLGSAYGQAPSNTGAPAVYDGIMSKPNGGPHAKISPEDFRLLTIKHLMQSPSPLQVGNAQLHRLGDQAAVDIMKVLGTGTPSEAQVPTILDMLRKAYERPAAILKPSDRQPKAVLFLLQALDSATQNQSIKLNIAQTKEFIATAAGAVVP